ncbi:thiosulfate/3-mercaptopyruvate sulfurtransferase [Nocardioides zeae]|uniref:Thiosulfate/3-mercaptopyruvate sulfurtransferase n=2 Tax=Nocardioides zeae TaxID=1457234 RepID=A0ACC6IKG8_9ACTN|nr:sulfurtransferase [Nocardioides zeae]MDQ1104943.1 thiosulfate/3-mercaptopyruvate sulfurtransferase [Nocardioides zeae]MDR6175343.1 thiosulfate/3-mercaptopyruvate sulfurtransferase [Nocardioides zeae]MDR6211165.1 thiosulfate/3-mercaptopyruvate sulfurtransferase [Nocardioides zeae]
MTSDVLVSAAELAAQIARGDDLVVLDVRWRLGGPPGHGEYLTGHVPGAVYVDLDTELAAHGEPTDGRHPLPDVAALQEAARRWGVRRGSRVVAYDGAGNLAAARAWWLLRWAGVTDVRLLDGALPAWTAAGGGLETDDVVPEPGDVELTPGGLPTVDLASVGDVPRDGVLLDARAPERFRGEVEPVDPKAGHVPGATSAPTGDNLDADGRFLPADVLRERFAALGADGSRPVAVYCGSGVTAAHQVAALAVAGVDAALYPGSWSQWSNHDLPVATGS